MQFVIRYVGQDPRGGKDITPEESAAIKAAGLARVLFYQPRRAFVPTSSDNGEAAARLAVKQATECGMPKGRPIYFVVDGDTRGFPPEQWEPIDAFFRAVNGAIGLEQTGVYGGINTVERMRDAGLASWFIQTASWSDGQWADVHLRQFDHRIQMCGSEVDFDQAMKTDYGQW